eukprot:1806507-Amphidinium_carterae.1
MILTKKTNSKLIRTRFKTDVSEVSDTDALEDLSGSCAKSATKDPRDLINTSLQLWRVLSTLVYFPDDCHPPEARQNPPTQQSSKWVPNNEWAAPMLSKSNMYKPMDSP